MGALKPEMIALFHNCCLNRAPALVLNPESDSICHARFAAVSYDSVILHLMDQVCNLIENSRLFVSFSQNGNCCAFFATMEEYKDQSILSPASLSLKPSTRIIGMESRMSYRVPIGEKVVPTVRVTTTEGQTFLPKPIDLSLTGILIEFDETEDPDLFLYDELGLELSLDKEMVQLKSVVKRRDGHRYGLFFPESVNMRGVNAPHSLRTIVESLERAFLKDSNIHDDA